VVESQTNRRLAAILAADVVGYSRMMGADEGGTLMALKRHRETVFNPAVAEHKGRVVKLIGDGTLVEFGSVVDAVNCALAIQGALANEPAASGNIALRIGINLGDVIIDGDDIYGDGVNIAARLEPLAEPGGVCIASIVNESIGNRIDVAFENGGEVHVKNIDRPIRVWKWHPGNGGNPISADLRTAPMPKPVREAPSIAVLPFENMSGDSEQEYFSNGITEDIITDLSKVGGLLVIARNSSFAYKGRNIDIRTIGRELGVRSVLEGSIRRAVNRVRITAQLVDAGNGGHLWAERYDRDLTDIFAVQDEVTRQIVGALKVTLSPAGANALAAGAPTSVDAHDLFLRGRALVYGSVKTRETFERASDFLRRAVECDPGYAEAYALLSTLCALDYQNRWSRDSGQSAAEALRLADQAIDRNSKEPFGHYAAAVAAVLTGSLERALAATEAALALNPNFALAYDSRGVIHLLSGEPLAAIQCFETAMRLDPAYSQQYIHFLGFAYLVAGKYATAAAYFRERIILVPTTDFSRAFLVSALGHLDQFDEARQVWSKLKVINPKYSFDEHINRWPFKNQSDVGRIREGLTKAGVHD
jgi:adenylate cyclase